MQIDVTGVAVDRVRGERHAVIVETDTRVKCVRIGLFGMPENSSVRGNAIQVGFAARIAH